MSNALDLLRHVNPAPPSSATGSDALYAAIVSSPRERADIAAPRPRSRRVAGLAIAGAVLVPVGAAATGVFDPIAEFRSGGEHGVEWGEHPALGSATVDERTSRKALTRTLPDGRRVEIWSALLTDGAGACVGARLAGESRLLHAGTAPCGPFRERIDPQGQTLLLSGFEDPAFADIQAAGARFRVVFGLLSPATARRATEVRVAGVPREIRVAPGSLRSPARGVYAVVLTDFDPMNESWPALEARDARGRVIASLPGACDPRRCG